MQSANKNIDDTIALLKKLRPVVKTALPAAAAAVVGVGFLDLKGLASKYTSLDSGNYYYVKETWKQCEYCVEDIDNALLWAGQKNKVLDELESAHRSQGNL